MLYGKRKQTWCWHFLNCLILRQVCFWFTTKEACQERGIVTPIWERKVDNVIFQEETTLKQSSIMSMLTCVSKEGYPQNQSTQALISLRPTYPLIGLLKFFIIWFLLISTQSPPCNHSNPYLSPFISYNSIFPYPALISMPSVHDVHLTGHSLPEHPTSISLL